MSDRAAGEGGFRGGGLLFCLFVLVKRYLDEGDEYFHWVETGVGGF